jgi:hypothetical protein
MFINFKKKILIVFFSLFLQTAIIVAGLMQNPFANLSEEEIVEMQRGFEADLNNYLSELSEEERTAFFEEMEEFERRLNEMPEEELNQFVESIFTEAGFPIQKQPSTPPPAPEDPPVKAKKKPVKKQKLSNTEEIAKITDELINQIEQLLRKIQSMPDSSSIIDPLIKVDIVPGIPEDFSWHMLKIEIEKLNSALYKLKMKDSKTKIHKHFATITENKELLEAFKKLNTDMKQQLPLITIPSFGMGKITQETKIALKTILHSCIQMIYGFDLLKKIDGIFKTYESEETVILKNQTKMKEDARKKTHEGKTPSRMRESSGRSLYSKSKDNSQSKAVLAKNNKSQTSSRKDAHSDYLASSLQKIDTKLTHFANLVGNDNNSSQPTIIEIDKHFLDQSPVDSYLSASINEASYCIKRIEREIAQLKNNDFFSEKEQKHLKKIINAHSQTLDSVTSTCKKLHNNDIFAKASSDKVYAYCGGKKKNEANAQVVKKIKNPGSIDELEKNVLLLSKTINTIIKPEHITA